MRTEGQRRERSLRSGGHGLPRTDVQWEVLASGANLWKSDRGCGLTKFKFARLAAVLQLHALYVDLRVLLIRTAARRLDPGR